MYQGNIFKPYEIICRVLPFWNSKRVPQGRSRQKRVNNHHRPLEIQSHRAFDQNTQSSFKISNLIIEDPKF